MNANNIGETGITKCSWQALEEPVTVSKYIQQSTNYGLVSSLPLTQPRDINMPDNYPWQQSLCYQYNYSIIDQINLSEL